MLSPESIVHGILAHPQLSHDLPAGKLRQMRMIVSVVCEGVALVDYPA
jgi:hypothetical protein